MKTIIILTIILIIAVFVVGFQSNGSKSMQQQNQDKTGLVVYRRLFICHYIILVFKD